jgi:hypothetical protein
MQARATGKKRNLLASSSSRLQTMAVLLRLVSMVPMPVKTPHKFMFCAVDSMPKLLLDVTGRNVGQ